MYNKLSLLGNLTKEVEYKQLQGGTALAILSVATNHRYKRENGESVDEVCYIDVKFFGKNAENCKQYLKKGSQVFIEGRLVLETWTDQAGNKKSRHTVAGDVLRMCGNNGNSGNNNNDNVQQPQQPQQPQTTPKINYPGEWE